jgi:hypothetical protein
MRSLKNRTPYQILFGLLCQGVGWGAIIGKRCVQGVVGKPQRKSLRGRRRHRWEDDIKLIIKNVGLGMDWIDLTQDRDRRRAFENETMHCHFREMWKIS